MYSCTETINKPFSNFLFEPFPILILTDLIKFILFYEASVAAGSCMLLQVFQLRNVKIFKVFERKINWLSARRRRRGHWQTKINQHLREHNFFSFWGIKVG